MYQIQYTPVTFITPQTREIKDPVTGKKTGKSEPLFYYGVRDASGSIAGIVNVAVPFDRAEQQSRLMADQYNQMAKLRKSKPLKKTA
jgi:hypothetical protein